MMRLSRAALAAALAFPCVSAAAAQDLAAIRISQARAHSDHVQAYVATLDRDLRPAGPPLGARFQASLGGKPLRVEAVQPLDRTDEGVGYVFLLDVSRSLSPAEFEDLRRSVDAWIGSMGPRDRAAIVTFGSDVRIAANFTATKDVLRAVLSRLRRTGDRTELYGGIATAMQLEQRQDPGLPDRRVVVLLSDGESDSPRGMTRGELLERMAGTRLPIYAVGYAEGGRRGSGARRGLATLAEITRRSGGAYVEAGGPDLSAVYSGLMTLVRSVYVLRLECDGCIRSASTQRLDVSLAAGPALYSDAVDLRTPVIPPSSSIWVRVAQGAAAAALLVAAGLLLRRRRRKRAELARLALQAGAPHPPFPPGRPIPPAFARRPAPSAPVPPAPPSPPPVPRGPEVLLTVVHAQSEVGTRVVDLGAARIVGRDQHRADVAFPEDETMSGRHFELSFEHGALVVRDLGSTNGTLLNGVVVRPAHRVEDGDVIGAGNTRIRVSFPLVPAHRG